MANLKPLLDAAQRADAEMIQIRDEILRLADEGTEESVTKAKDLRPKLEAAKTKAEEANQLYASVRDASLVQDNVAPLFTPPADPAKDDQAKAPKVMNRAAFEALNPAERMSFARSGGKVTD
jgi:hypothetical protein